jgi:mycothiol synthase
MVRVFNASQVADRIESVTSVDDFTRHYADLAGSDLSKDLILLESHGSVVGYSRVERWDGHVYLHTSYLLPEWRQPGSDRAVLRWSEGRAQQRCVEDAISGRAYVATFATDRRPEREGLLRAEGYVPVHHDYVMVRPHLDAIPQSLPPSGIEVRPVRENHLRSIWEAEVEAFRGVLPRSPLDEPEFERWRAKPNFQPERWQVAWEGGEIAGMIRNFVNEQENATFGRRRGYTEQISVRPRWRRRGLARALLASSLHLLRDCGMTEAGLGVNSTNEAALHLYQEMGFRITLRQTLYRKALARAVPMP